MRRAISVLAAVLFLASVPALAWAGPNPDVKLAMHVVATYDFLYCDDFAAALTTPGDMDPDVSQAELDAASGYAYVVFCAYDFDSVSGVEFQLSGWPTGRGTPPQPTMIWCPGSSLVLGDPWSGGAITAYGECWDAELDGAVDPFAWFVWGSASADYSAYLPMELSYIPSAYSYPANPHNYTLGCAPDFVEDSVVREYPGVIGGAVTAELEVVSPNGGEVLTGGTTYDIEWHSFGLDEVWIEYTTDGGGSWILVDAAKATSTTGNFVLNTFAWAVPEVNSELCKVRITGPGATPLDMSDDVFEITTSGGEQSIAVTAPNAGENFSVGAQTTITWTSENIENVKIQYGDTTRAVWTTIIETTPSGPTGGSYLWDIPDDTGQWFMKVCDAGDETPCDISDVRFQISELLDISAPEGGEVWQVGTEQTIAWTHAGIAFVNIEYGLMNWYPIASNVPAGDGSYEWTIPNDPGVWQVRVSDAEDGEPNPVSGAFQIFAPEVTVTAPNGGEVFAVGSEQSITWDSVGEFPSVGIEYATDGVERQTWQPVIPTTPNDGEFLWTVPDDVSTTCLVRICAIGTGVPEGTCDESDGVFTISQSIEVTLPVGGEVWEVGSVEQIAWTSGGIANVSIAYGFEEGKGWTTIETSYDASLTPYDWTIPDDPGTYYIRVCDANDGSPCDDSDGMIEIVEMIEVTVPAGGEDWQVDSTQDVEWQSAGLSEVNIYYGYFWKGDFVKGGGGGTIVEGYDAEAGSYSWGIPNDPGYWQVLIEDAEDATPYDMSDGFYITLPTVTLTRPNGEEIFVVGTQESITWESTGVFDYVSLEYMTDVDKGGWIEITPQTDNDGDYDWTVPDDPSEWCLVRVCVVNPPGGDPICDESDGTFEIQMQEAITVIYPNGGESFLVGDPVEITWEATEIETVIIYYGDDLQGWTEIATVWPASGGSYMWTAPDDPGDWFIKICDEADGEPCDLSDDTFNIHETIELTYPVGGERFEVDSQVLITWTSVGIDSIRIYFREIGGSWDIVVFPTGAASGEYLWTVPNVTPGMYEMYAFDHEDGTPGDTSDPFEIFLPGITVTYPNGGESFVVGDPVEITWTCSDVEYVNIEYGVPDPRNGDNWTMIAYGAPSGPTGGSYSWTAPDDPGDWFVRICNVEGDKAIVCDLSDDTFNIHETIELTYPVGGERFEVDSQVLITWESVGIDSIRIYFREIGGSWDIVVFPTDAASGQYMWTVPNVTPGMYEMFAFDHEDGTPGDTSDPFEIFLPGITVVYPNGGESFVVGDPVEITWTCSDVEYVSIEYGVPDPREGKGWTSIDGFVPSGPTGGSYMWTAPDDPGDWFVRICNVDDVKAIVCDLSDDTFNIHETITVTYPNGGESFVVGEGIEITWDSMGLDKVSIEYGEPEDGKGWTMIDDFAPSGPIGGSYMWTAPDDPGDWFIRICDAQDGDPCDLSDATFNIHETIELTYPVGGERFEVDSQVLITWTSVGIDSIRIYFREIGGSWDIVVFPTDAASGQYMWTVPNVMPGMYEMFAFDHEDGTPGDTSDPFEIFLPGITVVYPNGGESFVVGDPVDITWTSTDIDYVDIEYGLPEDKGWTPIAYGVPSDAGGGSYMWMAPDDPGDWFVRICNVDDVKVQVCDLSDSTFNIHETIDLTYPVGGEVFTIGDPVLITWTSVGIDSIRIYFREIGGAWNIIAFPTGAASGEFPWTVPDVTPGMYEMRIFDHEDGTPADQSDPFEIVPIPTYRVSGCVDYMHNGDPVPGVDLALDEMVKAETTTGSDGCYEFTDVESGLSYTLAPWKYNDVPLFTVMGWDAALCARVVGGLPIPLDGGHFPPTHAESLSCDMDQDGIIDLVDADNVARRAAGLGFVKSEPEVGTEWIFEPEMRFIPDLSGDVTDQDFSAVLLGDVDGNWGPMLKNGPAFTEGIRATYDPVNMTLEVFIRVRPAPNVVSMDCAVSYHPGILRMISAQVGDGFDGFDSVVNDNEDGLVYLCAYRPDPVLVRGRGPTVIFEVMAADQLENGIMTLEGFYLNDQVVGYGPLAYVGVWEIPAGGLGGIQPNPFNPETAISFTLPDGDPIQTSLKIYNAQGQLVRTLVDEVMHAGEHTAHWDGHSDSGVEVATGVFFCVLESGTIHDSKKMMLLK